MEPFAEVIADHQPQAAVASGSELNAEPVEAGMLVTDVSGTQRCPSHVPTNCVLSRPPPAVPHHSP